jgi:hypothetical protein
MIMLLPFPWVHRKAIGRPFEGPPDALDFVLLIAYMRARPSERSEKK